MLKLLRLTLISLTTAALPLAALADRRNVDLPEFGEPADAFLSPAEEYRIGRDVVSQMYAYNYLLEDPELQHYLSIMGWRLAAKIPNKPPELNFFMVRDSRINAFALPGGFIGFNAGLLMASDSESEVAGVMAHELQHVVQRHIARTIQGTQATNIATWLAVLAAIIAGSANPDVVLAALSLGQGLSYQNQVNYTRTHELEADRLGIRVLAQAGYDPNGMASFFQRLEQQSRLYGAGLPEILRTHPVNTTRIAEARTRAADYPAVQVDDSLDYRLMKARVRVLVADRPSEPVEYFARQLSAGNTGPEIHYGSALALSELGQYDRALAALLEAQKHHPRQANLDLLEANILLAKRQADDAKAKFAKTLEHFPKYSPAILDYADALLSLGEPDQARQLLLASEMTLGPHLQTYRLLAHAAQAQGDNAEVAFQMANFLIARGDAPGALRQLNAGLRIAGLSEQDRARLQARQEEVKEMLPRGYRDEELQRRPRGSNLGLAIHKH